jgi:hypothetical protein
MMLPDSTVEMIKITVESMNPHGWTLPPQYDEAIIGMAHVDANGPVVCYSLNETLDVMERLRGVTSEQAANWLHSNILTTSEPGAPVFLSIPVETAMQ